MTTRPIDTEMSEEEDDPTRKVPDEDAGEAVLPARRKPRPMGESHGHVHRGCGHGCRGAAFPDPRIASLSPMDRRVLAEMFNRFVGNRQERIDGNTVIILTSEEVDAAVSAAEKSTDFGMTPLGRRAVASVRRGLGKE